MRRTYNHITTVFLLTAPQITGLAAHAVPSAFIGKTQTQIIAMDKLQTEANEVIDSFEDAIQKSLTGKFYYFSGQLIKFPLENVRDPYKLYTRSIQIITSPDNAIFFNDKLNASIALDSLELMGFSVIKYQKQKKAPINSDTKKEYLEKLNLFKERMSKSDTEATLSINKAIAQVETFADTTSKIKQIAELTVKIASALKEQEVGAILEAAKDVVSELNSAYKKNWYERYLRARILVANFDNDPEKTVRSLAKLMKKESRKSGKWEVLYYEIISLGDFITKYNKKNALASVGSYRQAVSYATFDNYLLNSYRIRMAVASVFHKAISSGIKQIERLSPKYALRMMHLNEQKIAKNAKLFSGKRKAELVQFVIEHPEFASRKTLSLSMFQSWQDPKSDLQQALERIEQKLDQLSDQVKQSAVQNGDPRVLALPEEWDRSS